jgi:outer membrane protein OmpA-like peptidoglycan-associated protein
VLTISSVVFVLGFAVPVQASPKRPITFVVDTRLSEGPAENFTELFVDPRKLSNMLQPLDNADRLRPQATVTDDQIAINDRIFFAPGSNEIRPSSHPILDKVAQVLLLRPDIEEVSIQGHTARDANGDINLAMSVRRSKAVVDYLVAKGVALERISSIGFGQTRSESGDKNNRVEFVIEKWSDTRLASETSTSHDASKTDEPGSILIENRHSYTAEVAVNGTRIGTVGPYTDAAIHGLHGGLYDVRFTHTSGYSYFEAVRTGEVKSPIVPGGKPAAASLPNHGLPATQSAE